MGARTLGEGGPRDMRRLNEHTVVYGMSVWAVGHHFAYAAVLGLGGLFLTFFAKRMVDLTTVWENRVVGAVAAGLILVGLYHLAKGWLKRATTDYYLDPRFCIVGRMDGILSKSDSSVRFSDVRSVLVTQSFAQRLCGCCDLQLDSVGDNDAEVTWEWIPRVLGEKMKRDIAQYQSSEHARTRRPEKGDWAR
jgi:uncharacterized membrane protein YdbT with pleckstrin-like domain